MALETVLIHELELPVPFTCADGAGIEKGTLLKLTDPMTVALSDGAADIIAGISAEEKIANDGGKSRDLEINCFKNMRKMARSLS